MSKVIVISGASSGFAALTTRALADAGNTVYAGIRETAGRNANRDTEAREYAEEQGVDLRTVALDVSSQDSVDAGVARIIEETGHPDVVVHNAGHMVNGPTEAFTPEEIARLRHQRARHPAPEPRHAAPPAKAGPWPSAAGRKLQY